MAPRSYNQFCGLARALDLLGERWTLLVVRELMLGPKRFRDLLGALPGIGTNLLSARLKTLEADGLVQRIQLPQPAYALTDHGERLRPMLDGLALWGYDLLPQDPGTATARATWAALSMRAAAERDGRALPHGTIAFTIGDEEFYLTADGDELELRDGRPATDPEVHVTAGHDAFFALADRRVTPAAAVRNGQITVDGDRRLLERLLAAAHLPPRGTWHGAPSEHVE